MNVILIEDRRGFGDHLLAAPQACLRALGFECSGAPVRDVPGAFAFRTAETLRDDAVEDVVAITRDQGQVVLSDGRGELAMALEAWCALSKHLQTRIVVARHDALGVEFAVFEGGETRRLASWEAGEPPLSFGAPLPQEALFAAPCPELEELVEWVGCMGFDVEAMNRRALYQLWPVRALASGTQASWSFEVAV